MSEVTQSSKKIIIEGVTHKGAKFRPSDWAERVSGSLSTFKNHRIYYSPLLTPSYQNGHRCLLLDPKLKQSNPKLFDQIMNFANTNNLRICGQVEDSIEQSDESK